MSGRLKELVVQYGMIALVVHYTIGVLVMIGMYVAVRSGLEPHGAAQNAGVWAAAYGAYKASMVVRVPVTLFLTPFVARLCRRLTGRSQPRCPIAVVVEEASAQIPTAERVTPGG